MKEIFGLARSVMVCALTRTVDVLFAPSDFIVPARVMREECKECEFETAAIVGLV